ncbi:MAG: hypothetical protein AAFR61_21690 [Bacteroidota bacterium]
MTIENTFLRLTFFTLILTWLSFSLRAQEGFVLEADSFNYRITFPQEPVANNSIMRSPKGKIYINSYFYKTGEDSAEDNLLFLVNYTKYPAEATDWHSEEERKNLFRGAVDGFVASVRGELVREEEVEFSGYPGRKVQVKTADEILLFNVRIYMVDDKLYLLQVASKIEAYPNEEADAFLDSFSFLGPFEALPEKDDK